MRKGEWIIITSPYDDETDNYEIGDFGRVVGYQNNRVDYRAVQFVRVLNHLGFEGECCWNVSPNECIVLSKTMKQDEVKAVADIIKGNV